ncbi:MAG: TlpA disulfide reductase family protein [Bdellovibrionota bacterium]
MHRRGTRNSIFVALSLLVFVLAGCNHGSAEKAAQTNGAGEPKSERSGDKGTSPADSEAFVAGAAAPEISLTDLNGKHVSLKDFRGKTVLLNFWATWCVPCVAEMGSLQRLYKTYQSQNFEIVSVNVDSADSQDNVVKFVKDNGISFTVFRDPELTYPPVYGLSGFPETFFIGPDGKFLTYADPGENRSTVRVVGDRAWDSPASLKAVKDLLGK